MLYIRYQVLSIKNLGVARKYGTGLVNHYACYKTLALTVYVA